MPEGNTIHWLARRHNRDYAGRRVRVSSPQGRFDKEAKRLDRREFLQAEAYGKHLFHHWQGKLIVHIHLGMAGWFYRHAGGPPDPRPSVRMRLSAARGHNRPHRPSSLRNRHRGKARRDPRAAGPGSPPPRFRPGAGRVEEPRAAAAVLHRRRATGPESHGRSRKHLPQRSLLPGRDPAAAAHRRVRREAEWERLWRILRDLMRRRGRRRPDRDDRARREVHPLAERAARRRLLRLPAEPMPAMRRANSRDDSLGPEDVRVPLLPGMSGGRKASPDPIARIRARVVGFVQATDAETRKEDST